MIRKMLLPLVLCFLAVACASTTVPQTSSPVAERAMSEQLGIVEEAAELRSELRVAYEHIVARGSGASKPAVADTQALISIEIPQHKAIDGAVRYFSTDLQSKIQKSLLRSAEHKGMVDRVLDEYKLPRALAYLPVIESAYVPTLTSKAGAYGLWQFMPATGAEYGLRINWWLDERANPEKSTRAAARYLRDLYGMFHDWSLALAAYNAGPGRIRRALASSGSSSFWELSEKQAIPQETRGYVPTFFATVIIASDPAQYGFTLKESTARQSERVSIQGPVSLSYIADVSGVSEGVLRELNPDLHRGVVPPGKAQIRIPPAAVAIIQSRSGTLRHEDPVMKIATFTLRPGETLSTVARTLNVSRQDVLRMNGLDQDARAGDSIYLPVHQTELSSLLQKDAAPADRYYRVSAGDTLYSIARRHGLTVPELLDLNRLTSGHTIHAGDELRISLGAALTSGGM